MIQKSKRYVHSIDVVCLFVFFFHTACVMRNGFFRCLGGLSLTNTTAPALDLSLFLVNFVKNWKFPFALYKGPLTMRYKIILSFCLNIFQIGPTFFGNVPDLFHPTKSFFFGGYRCLILCYLLARCRWGHLIYSVLLCNWQNRRLILEQFWRNVSLHLPQSGVSQPQKKSPLS